MIRLTSNLRSISVGLQKLYGQGCTATVYRTLYNSTVLGVDNYSKARERIKTQFANVEDKFRMKMSAYANQDSNSMIFTEDLKHMIHLVEGTDQDLELVRNMMLKFSSQNRELRFGSFIFGPVVMRMYYFVNRPKEAFEMFMNPEMDGFFDQLMSFQILMDLLLKNEMYEEVIQVFDVIQKKQVQGSKFPKNAVVLVLAACYKLNTAESFNYAKNLWSEFTKYGHYPMRRAGTFAAALALNQKSPHVALEILSSTKQQTYVTIRNLKVAALADLNRPDDTFPILRSVLQTDSATEKKHTFCEEIIAKTKASVKKLGKPDILQEFEKLENQLRNLNHITSESLDKQLCAEISMGDHSTREPRVRYERRPQQRLRPGLEDMY
ncbi:pentatricopeptide repeat-containing protein 2, mitochondrial-like [Rhodnius prolixus]|uniref:pentatricopeptide repeat-containing protein 2, mitochondrial-like n=1 Tax=Rhodnius prolixus TaxID=13249 RepID=UPI003D18BA8F